MSANFDSYRIFYYVGKFRNITHAANALFLSQSTVSRTVQSLEYELNCRLFERSQQGVTLTAEGELLYRHVAQAMEHIQTAEETVRQMQLLEGGRIVIGVTDFTFQQYVLPVLRPFHSDHPSVQLEVSTLNSGSQESMMDALASGLVDVACICSPVPANENILVESIAEFTDVLIAGARYSELQGRSFHLSELVNSYPFANLTGGSDGFTYLERVMEARGMSIVPAFRVNSISMFLPLVEQGLCLAVLPGAFLKTMPKDSGIMQVSLSDTFPPRSVCIATAKDQAPSALREEFVRALRRSVQSSGSSPVPR